VFEHGFVEEPVIWTLDQDKRAESPAQTSRAQHRAPALTTCPECSAVRLEGRPCPACGWRPQPKPRPVAVADGELGQVDSQRRVKAHTPTIADKVSFQRQLRWIERERGYRPGWTAHKFRERFGHWPARNDVEPLPPNGATRAWVRSQQIAYARAIARGAT
jgi:hypothetical protein